MFWRHYFIVKLNCFILRTSTVAGLGVPIFRVFMVSRRNEMKNVVIILSGTILTYDIFFFFSFYSLLKIIDINTLSFSFFSLFFSDLFFQTFGSVRRKTKTRNAFYLFFFQSIKYM